MQSINVFRSVWGHVFSWSTTRITPLISTRFARHQAFDVGFDQDELVEARNWRLKLQPNSLPKGNTTFSRSQGAGGQHVNKTETKATTIWPVPQLLAGLPKMMHAEIRASKYYSKNNDSITMQAQTHRSRSANTDENHQKLLDEIRSIYQKVVPGESSPDKARKYEALKKVANEVRVKSKKQLSSKKQSRKGSSDY